MLYIPEALRHTVMPGLQPGWTRKDIQHLPRFLSAFQKTIHVIYPRSTQAYSHARTSTWMNQKKIYNICLDFYLHLKKLSMLYIPEALRHTVMPGLHPGWTRKDIQHLLRFLSVFQKTIHVTYPRSTQAYSHARTSSWMNQKIYTTFA